MLEIHLLKTVREDLHGVHIFLYENGVIYQELVFTLITHLAKGNLLQDPMNLCCVRKILQ